MLQAMPSEPSLRSQWFPPEGSASPPYAAKHRIVDHVRFFTEALVGAEVAAVDPAELAELEDAFASLRKRVEALPDVRRRGSMAKMPLPDGSLIERSPVSGRGNALSLPLHYEFDGETTRAWAVFSRAYEGPPGGVHGGYVAAAFDELLGVAQMVTGLAGFTGTLTVRYHRLTPVGERVEYEARPGDRDGRKITMCATARAGGQVVAEAEGLFIAQVELEDGDRNTWANRT